MDVCVWWGGGGEGGRGGSGYVDETSRVTSTQKAKKNLDLIGQHKACAHWWWGRWGGGGGGGVNRSVQGNR